MIRMRYIGIVSALILLFSLLTAMATGTPGSAQDPVVSLSYIQETFLPKVTELLTKKADEAFKQKEAEAAVKVEAVVRDAEKNLSLNADQLKDRVSYDVYMRMLDRGFYLQANPASVLTLKNGERVVIAGHGSFTVLEGSATIGGYAKDTFVNATAGGAANVNTTATRNARYIASDEGILSVKATSDKVRIAVQGSYQIVPVYRAQYTEMAGTLKEINLFRGSNLGFELEREPTRLEALILFLRLIGEEQQALAFTGKHPFTDVPKWGGGESDKYVAYAYAKGYTNGVSQNKFGSSSKATLEQYLTFVLRALGYQDGTDFKWNESPDYAKAIGILLEGDTEKIIRRGFYRDHVVYVSYYSLKANLKNSGTTLIRTLVQKGLISEQLAQTTITAFPR